MTYLDEPGILHKRLDLSMLVHIVLDSMVETLDQRHVGSGPAIREKALLCPNIEEPAERRVPKEVVHGCDNTVLTEEGVDAFQRVIHVRTPVCHCVKLDVLCSDFCYWVDD